MQNEIDTEGVATVCVSVGFETNHTTIFEGVVSVDMTFDDLKKECVKELESLQIDLQKMGPLVFVCPVTEDIIQVEDLGGYFEASGERVFNLILRPYTKEELKLLSAEEEYEQAKRALKEAEEEHRLSKRQLKRTKTEPL